MALTPKKQSGNRGENLAYAYLKNKGYEMIGQNVQCGRSEIDIIAKYNNRLIFVEVKTRKDSFFGLPESFVTEAKQKALCRGAQWYIEKNNYHGELQFDIVAVVLNQKKTDITHFEDAFWVVE